ncbi:MAG: hypothetical protein R3C25_01825 [Hyphomonadaceae bacterium]
MQVRERVRVVIESLPAVVAFAIALLTLVPGDILNLILPQQRLTERLLIGVLLLVCGASYLHLYLDRARERKGASQLEAKIEGIRSHIAALRNNTDLIAQTRAQLDLLPPRARALSSFAGSYMLSRIDDILNRQFFDVRGGFFFQDFYRKVFEELQPPCDLIATADATPTYFWRGRDLNELFRGFIARGGTLTRIFFIDSLEQLQNPATLDIMRGQHAADVRVYWVLRSDLPDVRYMIADKQMTFGWQLYTNSAGEIESVNVSWNTQTAEERYNYLYRVLHHERTQRFTG